MLHDGLMLNEERLHFTQDGNVFYREPGATDPRRKKVFTASVPMPDGDVGIAEAALKEFVIWCYDRHITPVRVPRHE